MSTASASSLVPSDSFWPAVPACPSLLSLRGRDPLSAESYRLSVSFVTPEISEAVFSSLVGTPTSLLSVYLLPPNQYRGSSYNRRYPFLPDPLNSCPRITMLLAADCRDTTPNRQQQHFSALLKAAGSGLSWVRHCRCEGLQKALVPPVMGTVCRVKPRAAAVYTASNNALSFLSPTATGVANLEPRAYAASSSDWSAERCPDALAAPSPQTRHITAIGRA